MRVLACLCVIAVVVTAFFTGGCGSGTCGNEGTRCDSGSSFDCCGSLICADTGGGNFYCVHSVLTAVPSGR